MRYFFYGSLMDPTIAIIVLDRPVRAHDLQPATLTGYTPMRVQDEHYPALVSSTGDETRGVLVSDISALQARRLQFYETVEFHLATVEVVTADTLLEAHVFMPAANSRHRGTWHFDNFLESAGPDYVRHTRLWMQGFGQWSTQHMKFLGIGTSTRSFPVGLRRLWYLRDLERVCNALRSYLEVRASFNIRASSAIMSET